MNVLLSGIAGFALAGYQLRFAWIWPLMVLHAASDFTAIHARVEAPVTWYVAIHLMFVVVGIAYCRWAAVTGQRPEPTAAITARPFGGSAAS